VGQFVFSVGSIASDHASACWAARSLERTLDLPVAVLVLWAGYSPTLDDIRKHAFEPVFVRAQR
jgi:hypothetical protein